MTGARQGLLVGLVSAVAGSGVAFLLLAWLWPPGGDTATAPGTASSAMAGASSPATEHATPSSTGTASPGTRDAVSSTAPGTAASATRPSCVDTHYKTADGPAQKCVPTAEVCALGAPYYVAGLDTLCGPVKTAHLTLDGSTSVREGDCLANTGTGWARAPVEDRGADRPAADCNAYVDRVRKVSGSQTCTPTYPGTRMTFPADIAADGGTTTPVCVSVNMGA